MTVLVSRDDRVAVVTLARTARHNSLVPDFLVSIRDAIAAASGDHEVGAIVLAAEGPTFSTGGDVAAFAARDEDLAEYAHEVVGLLNEVVLTMLRSPTPIFAAVHGMVTGGSIGLVFGSDVVVIGPNASFTPWYTTVGFGPDGGWTALAPRVIGRQRAADALLAHRTISAHDAISWGLASRLTDEGAELDMAIALARGAAARKPNATAVAKGLLVGDLATVADRLERERTAFVAQVVTPESRRGMEEFLS